MNKADDKYQHDCEGRKGDGGKILRDGTPAEVFTDSKMLKEAGLGIPQVTELARVMREAGFPLPAGITTVAQAKEEILKLC